ncbi:hypothetical protein BGW41_003593 [Actinomortierella wolfii]|nr:hypothetical protein BGW41_003593 [Actinomortierella wolfii]
MFSNVILIGNPGVDVPGLLEATQERIANNARVITEAFRTDGPFKLIFVFAGQSGRVPPSDLFTIGKVMSAVDFAVDVGVIINNVPESQVKLYHDNRKPIVESLNSCANGRIVDGWFTVIPNFPEDNPKGPMPYMTALLTTMTSQDIPRVTPISMETNEFNHFVEFVKRFKEYVQTLDGMELTNVLLVGKSGVGKSFLLNSLGGKFDSGFSLVHGKSTEHSSCEVTIRGSTIRLLDVPGLLEVSNENIARNAKEITEALRAKGRFKVIFVLSDNGGRIHSQDLYEIGKVMSAIDFSIDVGVIFNRTLPQHLERYSDATVRDTILNQLNSTAKGRFKREWFAAIPLFNPNDPKGPRLIMINLLESMVPQRIPTVKPIRAKIKELNFFLRFSVVKGLTEKWSYCESKVGGSTVRLVDTPGLLETSGDLMLRNAEEITKALSMEGGYKLIFVLSGCAGRVSPSDLYMINKVMAAIDFSIHAGVIVNIVPNNQVDLYEEASTRNKICQQLNSVANNMIKSEWMRAIPCSLDNNFEGATSRMTELLEDMIFQDIPHVRNIAATFIEHTQFVEYMERTNMDHEQGAIWLKEHMPQEDDEDYESDEEPIHANVADNNKLTTGPEQPSEHEESALLVEGATTITVTSRAASADQLLHTHLSSKTPPTQFESITHEVEPYSSSPPTKVYVIITQTEELYV